MIRPEEFLGSMWELDHLRAIRDFIGSHADGNLIVLALLYIGAVGWILSRGSRSLAQPAENLSLGLGLVHVLPRLLGAVILVAFGVLLAVARAAGRSHFRW